MNSKIELKFKKIKEIQSKVQSDLCKLEDTYSNLLNPLNDIEKNKIKKDVEDLFNSKNDAFINTETNKNYHNLFETFLSTIKTRKLPEKREKKEIIQKKIVKSKRIEKKEEIKPVVVVEPSKRVENIINQKNKEETEIDIKIKEKEILNHEIENLKTKLIEMNKKTNGIKDKLEKPTTIQNYKLIDKLIDGFTEALLVHWEDLVEILIDDILLEEVNTLNKIEREKKMTLNNYEEYISYINEAYKVSQKDKKNNTTTPFKMNDFREVIDDILHQEKSMKIKHNI